MCGIIGYIGKSNAVKILLDGLKNLEYRGYDSAGLVVFFKNKKHLLIKKMGQVKILQEECFKKNIAGGFSGLGHSRWATHGAVSDRNAHPHWDCQKKFFIVHNGIIENYKELKEELLKENHKFTSETDTEVVAHLLEKYYDGDFYQAIERVLRRLSGAYALAGICKDNPGTIFFARLSSPLIIGKKNNEVFIASDVNAFIKHTKNVIYLDDYDYGLISLTNVVINNLRYKKIKESKVEVIDWSHQASLKKNYKHFMLKEILEGPEAIINTTRGRILLQANQVKLGGLEQVRRRLKLIDKIVICACGTAYNAGLAAKIFIEEYLKLPVTCEVASELRYRNFPYDPYTCLIVISQSGETIDTLKALQQAKKLGVLSLGVVNVVGSTIARTTDAGVYLHIGPEIAVASTKAYIAQVIVLYLIALYIAQLKNIEIPNKKGILKSIIKLPWQLKQILNHRQLIRSVAQSYKNCRHFFYLGRRYNYPVALEGALKLKEIAYVFAQGYSAGEMKHGPIALVDKRMTSIIVAPKDTVYKKTISNIEEIKARRGKVIVITNNKDSLIGNLADDILYVPKTSEELNPVLIGSTLHLFAYYFALINGKPIDKPRNLAKSVTVE